MIEKKSKVERKNTVKRRRTVKKLGIFEREDKVQQVTRSSKTLLKEYTCLKRETWSRK